MNLAGAFRAEDAVRAARLWGWLWLAFFLWNSGWFWDTVFLMLLKKPLPPALHVVSLCLAVAGGLLAGTVFCRKTWGEGKKFSEYLPSLAAGMLAASAIIYAVPVGMKAWGDYVLDAAGKGYVNSPAFVLMLAGIILAAAILLTWAGMATVVFMRYGAGFRNTKRAAALLTGVCLKRLPIFILTAAGLLLASPVLVKVMTGMEALASQYLPYGFYARWVLELVAAAGKAVVALLLVAACVRLLEGADESLQGLREGEGRGSYVFPALCAVLIIVLIFPGLVQNRDYPARYIQQVRQRMAAADGIWANGMTGAAAAEYVRCESELLALEGLLKGLAVNRLEEDAGQADELFLKAEEMRPDFRYVPFFRGLVNLKPAGEPDAYDDAAEYFMKAGRGKGGVPGAYLWAVHCYWQAGERKKALQAVNLAVARNVWVTGWGDLAGADSKRLAELQEQVRKVREMIADRRLRLLLNEAQYKPEPAVLSEAAALADRSGRAGDYYQVALLAERVPDTQYMYRYARKFWEARAKKGEADEEIKAALFTSYMYVKSGHPSHAARLMSAVYHKYPERPEVAGDYVYVLLENRGYREALAITEKFIKVQPEDMAYMQAVAYLRTGDLLGTARSLRVLCHSASDQAAGKEQVKKADTYLYRFLLEYLQWQKESPDAAARLVMILQQDEYTMTVFNYLMGLEKRQAEDYDQSNRYFRRVLETCPRLAYPYYFLGINASEMAGYLHENRYPEAEVCFLKFLAVHSDSAPGYFCLGNVYKHSGDYERAARAYRKVIDLNPRRDNPLYEPWGMYNHAAAELEKYSREGRM